MTTVTTRLSDVDIDAVSGLTGKIRDEPDVAATTWRARVEWQGGFRSAASVREFAPVSSDEPAALGDSDTAANPVEQLLAALGCGVPRAANTAVSL